MRTLVVMSTLLVFGCGNKAEVVPPLSSYDDIPAQYLHCRAAGGKMPGLLPRYTTPEAQSRSLDEWVNFGQGRDKSVRLCDVRAGEAADWYRARLSEYRKRLQE